MFHNALHQFLLLGENKMSFVELHNYEQSKAWRIMTITVGLCK